MAVIDTDLMIMDLVIDFLLKKFKHNIGSNQRDGVITYSLTESELNKVFRDNVEEVYQHVEQEMEDYYSVR